MERRRSKRYLLRAPVLFSWTDPAGTRHEGTGFTTDMSPVGVFVVCEESAPPVHSVLKLEVLVVSPTEREVRLRSDGRVVRVQERAPHHGFAAAADFQLEEENDLIRVQ